MRQSAEALEAAIAAVSAERENAAALGHTDGEKGAAFAPEQVGVWNWLYYAEAFYKAQKGNEDCKAWLARYYRRLAAEEAEMDFRETVIHAGGRFIGGSLVEAGA